MIAWLCLVLNVYNNYSVFAFVPMGCIILSPYLPFWFGPENIVCFLRLLHIFKSSKHGSTFNPGETASARFLSEKWVVGLYIPWNLYILEILSNFLHS